MNLDELKAEERDLNDQLFRNKLAQNEIITKEFEEETGIKVGSKIFFRDQKMKVSHLKPDGGSVFKITAHLYNSDGKLSARKKSIYPSEFKQIEIL